MLTSSVFQRRLASEWALLNELAACNPGRITDRRLHGGSIEFRLLGPLALPASGNGMAHPISEHSTRVEFPVHFPAVPMEMFLETPVFHPNVHPETGFVCLWDRHRVSNTVEHALHKLAAMLAGNLRNTSTLHVMQPDACHHPFRSEAMPLHGVQYDSCLADVCAAGSRKQRLQ